MGPREDRLDILQECRNPAYAQEGERTLPSWVRPLAQADRFGARAGVLRGFVPGE